MHWSCRGIDGLLGRNTLPILELTVHTMLRADSARLSRSRESGVLGRSGSRGRLRRALAEATVNHTELPQFITRALPL